MKKTLPPYVWLLFLLSLSGCNLSEKLATIGEAPQLSQIQNPTHLSGYQPLTMPMPTPLAHSHEKSASLWQTGAQAFFKDQRAGKEGDIVTVLVDVVQNESIEMTPNVSQQSTGSTRVGRVLGLAAKANPTWFDVTSQPRLSGAAKYEVKDKLNFKIAATIIQILPNGNMVINGRQEMRLVNEVREVVLTGIVRREDVSASNTVNWDKVAELRMGYGGRGELTDVQSSPYGQQFMNKVLPF